MGPAPSRYDRTESDGCLVVLAVFKTVVGPFHGSRQVRFLPSPPNSWFRRRRSGRRASRPGTRDLGPGILGKEVSAMSREQILKLTSLSSCAGLASKLSQEPLSQVLRQLPQAR